MSGMRYGVAISVVLLALVVPAFGFDLTGTWEGHSTCTSLFEGEKQKFSDAPTIQITQVGDAIGMRADYGGGDVDLYTGVAHPDPKKSAEKGEMALVACGTDSIAGNPGTFDEVGRFAVTTKVDKVKAAVKGLSFFSDPGVASPEAGTCKWRLTRVDTIDAAVPTTCPLGSSALRSRAVGAVVDDHHRRPR
jgi:hypothetical protein